ncbi:MAG TPA: threonine-phosphate decarboxylase CobD [Azonexus sp.]|jgi:cobalamin biosynthetic protein CobC|nr:threonine-phosphate decarboxylase CobD [Azonexus sp.]
MLEHGGQLRRAAARLRIPLPDWLDLSTGINPQGWPVPPLPASVWQRLPEAGDGLEAAAATYYGNPDGLAVAGSQAALQQLPALLPRAAVACLMPLYEEHPQAWARAGHTVHQVVDTAVDDALATGARHVLLCNPNNPTAARHRRADLLAAAARLQAGDGWLIVDEAFIDATPDESLAALAGTAAAANLVVLRSLGKFFGLAGVRAGFVFGAAGLRDRLGEMLGPWSVSGPARAVARLALQDAAWQAVARVRLQAASLRLQALLAPFGSVTTCALFATLQSPRAGELHEHLARSAILTRRFEQPSLLRIGLPGDETGWQRLGTALDTWSRP